MRSLLFLSSLLGLCWARTLLIQTEDKANSDITAMGYEDNIDDLAPEEPGNGKNTEIRKGTNFYLQWSGLTMTHSRFKRVVEYFNV